MFKLGLWNMYGIHVFWLLFVLWKLCSVLFCDYCKGGKNGLLMRARPVTYLYNTLQRLWYNVLTSNLNIYLDSKLCKLNDVNKSNNPV